MEHKFQPYVAEAIAKKKRTEELLQLEEEARRQFEEEAYLQKIHDEKETARILTEIAAKLNATRDAPQQEQKPSALNPKAEPFKPAPEPEQVPEQVPEQEPSTLNPKAESFVPAPQP